MSVNVLRFPGGKSRALRLIDSLAPESFREYREPFLGGGSVFLHFRSRTLCNPPLFRIGDLNPIVANFWKQLQTDPAILVHRVCEWKEDTLRGKELFQRIREQLPKMKPVDQAAAYFVLNRISFSGAALTGGYSQDAYENRFTDSACRNLLLAAPYLNNVNIQHASYEAMLMDPGNGVFIFLDPPYLSARKSRLYGDCTDFDHGKLAEELKRCRHNWLMTYDDTPDIRALYSWARVSQWTQIYGMRNVSEESNQTGKELFIQPPHEFITN